MSESELNVLAQKIQFLGKQNSMISLRNSELETQLKFTQEDLETVKKFKSETQSKLQILDSFKEKDSLLFEEKLKEFSKQEIIQCLLESLKRKDLELVELKNKIKGFSVSEHLSIVMQNSEMLEQMKLKDE